MNKESQDRTVGLLSEVRHAFGNPQPPNVITQKAFDYDTKHLHRLARPRLASPGGSTADPSRGG